MRYVARRSFVLGDERALKRVDGAGKDGAPRRWSGDLDSHRDLQRPSGRCRRESWAITVAIRQLCPKARARRSNPDERELRGRDSNPDNQLQRLASCRLDDPALGLVRIADRTGFRRSIWEHVFLPDRPRKYDWDAVRAYYEAGRSMRECQVRLSFANGASHEAMRRGDVVTGAPSKPKRMNRGGVARLLTQGLSAAQIARELGATKSAISFHMRALGVPARADFARRYDWDEIRRHYEAGHSITECRRRFGFIARGMARRNPARSDRSATRHDARDHLALRLATAVAILEQLFEAVLEEVEDLGLRYGRRDALALEPARQHDRAAVELGKQQRVSDRHRNFVA